MPVGAGAHQPERDPRNVDTGRPFQAALAPVDRGSSGPLAAAGRLGDRAVHADVLQRQADHLVVGGQGQGVELLADLGLGPDNQAATDGAVRALLSGDAFVPRAVHQGVDDARTPRGQGSADGGSPGVRRIELGRLRQQRVELDPDGFEQAMMGWQARDSRRSLSVENSMIDGSRACLLPRGYPSVRILAYCRSLLVLVCVVRQWRMGR